MLSVVLFYRCLPAKTDGFVRNRLRRISILLFLLLTNLSRPCLYQHSKTKHLNLLFLLQNQTKRTTAMMSTYKSWTEKRMWKFHFLKTNKIKVLIVIPVICFPELPAYREAIHGAPHRTWSDSLLGSCVTQPFHKSMLLHEVDARITI